MNTQTTLGYLNAIEGIRNTFTLVTAHLAAEEGSCDSPLFDALEDVDNVNFALDRMAMHLRGSIAEKGTVGECDG